MRYREFLGGSYTPQSILSDAERLVNWYPEKAESPNSKTPGALYPTPGFSKWCTTGTGIGGRALATMNGRTLGVMGNTIGEVFAAQTFSNYGTVNQDANLAQIAFNGPIGNQALIVSGGSANTLNLTTNVVTPVGSPPWTLSTMCGMLDGYGIIFDTTTGRIWVSHVNDMTLWDPTQFAARSAAPDTWKAMVVNPPDIWLIGSLSGDVWYDAGSFPFPFAPRQGINFKYGIIAPFSLVATGYAQLWLSQSLDGSGIVVRTRGYAPQRVSTYAVETAIANYASTSTIADAEGLVYQDQGHTFYVLQFPTANATWVYDLELNEWHERGYWDTAAMQYDAWKPRVHTFAFGTTHLTADRGTNTISQMSIMNATELDGSAIRRLRRAPGPFAEHRDIPVRRLEYYLETGTSLQSGQGSNAVVMHRTSDDGGRTWVHQANKLIGLVGKYKQKGVRFTRMGVPADRVNELTVSDPLINWRIVDAFINSDAPEAPQGR
jgi:hypothetical protein